MLAVSQDNFVKPEINLSAYSLESVKSGIPAFYRPKRFHRLINGVARAHISPTAKLVHAALVTDTDSFDLQYSASSSLAEKCRLPLRAFERGLAELAREQFIRIDPKPGDRHGLKFKTLLWHQDFTVLDIRSREHKGKERIFEPALAKPLPQWLTHKAHGFHYLQIPCGLVKTLASVYGPGSKFSSIDTVVFAPVLYHTKSSANYLAELSISELSENLGMRRPTISAGLKRLNKIGLLCHDGAVWGVRPNPLLLWDGCYVECKVERTRAWMKAQYHDLAFEYAP